MYSLLCEVTGHAFNGVAVMLLGQMSLCSCQDAVVALLLNLQAALKRYQTACGNAPERLVSGSDDYTMFLWEPSVSKKPLQRLTGHMQLINQVCTFSCNSLLARSQRCKPCSHSPLFR